MVLRLDSYLAKKHPGFSRSVLQKFIKMGRVTVDGKVVLEPKQKVSESNEIILSSILNPQSSKIDLPILYEDENVIVINKPAGILSHSKGALNEEFTVSDFIKCHSELVSESRQNKKWIPETSSGQALKQVQDDKQMANRPSNHITIQPSNRFGIVHRLDRGTSGVIIGAKNPETLKFLQKQFSNRKVKKNYLALVENASSLTNKLINQSTNQLTIDLPIARNPKKPSTFRVDPKGKPALTNVKVIEKYDDGTALLELKPLTGRTHQLRVHLAHIGSPIVGDNIYGASSSKLSRQRSRRLGQGYCLENSDDSANNRMMLHASALEITLPGGERKIFEASVPSEFKK